MREMASVIWVCLFSTLNSFLIPLPCVGKRISMRLIWPKQLRYLNLVRLLYGSSISSTNYILVQHQPSQNTGKCFLRVHLPPCSNNSQDFQIELKLRGIHLPLQFCNTIQKILSDWFWSVYFLPALFVFISWPKPWLVIVTTL